MIQKSEVLEKFKEFEAGVTNEIDKAIGTLPTDNGGEEEYVTVIARGQGFMAVS